MSEKYYHTAESVEEYIRLAEGHSGAQLIKKLKGFLPSGSALLELGSGPGTDWKILNADYAVTGSDNSSEFIKRLKGKYPDGRFLELDAAMLATDQAFDGIYSNKVMHHLTDDEIASSMQRQHKILNPNGIICHSFWKGEGSEVFKGLFVNYHTPQSLTKLLEGLFEILLLEEYQEFEEGDSLLLIGRKMESVD